LIDACFGRQSLFRAKKKGIDKPLILLAHKYDLLSFNGADRRPVLNSKWNGGFGAHSSPSGGDRRRHAIRPIEASKAAVSYVR
jgi:hypothetical protein